MKKIIAFISVAVLSAAALRAQEVDTPVDSLLSAAVPVDTLAMEHLAYANALMKIASSVSEPALIAQNYEEALVHLDTLVVTGKGDATIYLQRGQALEALGREKEAVESYSQAKHLGMADQADVQLSRLYLAKARSLYMEEDYAGAFENSIKSLEYGVSAAAYKIAGSAAAKTGDYAAAVDCLEKYLEVDPAAADATQKRAALDALKARLKKTE